MTVLVSGSDESSGRHHRSIFLHGGFVAPEEDWSNLFASAWQKSVLTGPPTIPYLHMTEIRSRAWREKYGLSAAEAERRVDEAFLVIESVGSLTPISSQINGGRFRDEFPSKMRVASGAMKKFEPDYIGFIGYVFVVLAYLEQEHLEVEKVDFIVERKTGITQQLKEFYDSMPKPLEELGLASQAKLLGELIPASKDRVPLQAADVLCWHSQRAETGRLSRIDENRYATLARRRGCRHEWTDDDITKLKLALSKSGP